MNEYVLIFRRNVGRNEDQPSPAQMQAAIKPWQEWLGSMAAQNKLANKGVRLQMDGRTIKSGNSVTNGPYSETKEIVGGLVIVKAEDYDDAVELARGCPILLAPWGGSVEVRQLLSV